MESSSSVAVVSPLVNRRPVCGGSLRRIGCSWLLMIHLWARVLPLKYYSNKKLSITKDDEHSLQGNGLRCLEAYVRSQEQLESTFMMK